jgi:hypothetical protein
LSSEGHEVLVYVHILEFEHELLEFFRCRGLGTRQLGTGSIWGHGKPSPVPLYADGVVADMGTSSMRSAVLSNLGDTKGKCRDYLHKLHPSYNSPL